MARLRNRADGSSPKSVAWLDAEHDCARMMESVMDPLTGGLIAGGASLLSGFMSSTTSASNVQAQIAAQQQMQGQAEQFNANQAQIARDYTTQMSNTAYQRASADMQKAGLNPMMMFGSGGPSSTPGSASPSISPQQVPIGSKANPLAGLGDAVSKTVSTAVDMKQMEQMTEAIANLKTQERLTAAQTLTEAKRPAQVAAQTGLTDEQAKSERQEQILRGPATIEASGTLGLPTGFLEKAGIAKYVAGGFSDMVSPLVNSALRLKGLGMLRREFDALEAARAAH